MNVLRSFRFPLGLLAVFVTAAVAAGAAQHHTRFVAVNCNTNPPQYTNYFTRDASITVALCPREGYQWGGGCWNDNDNDDSPGDPGNRGTGGEGGDCSGFTFKVWRRAGGQSRAARFTSGRCCGTSMARTWRTTSERRWGPELTPCPKRPRSRWTPSQARATSE